MENQTFTIPNISCGHCVMSIKNELTEITGVRSVTGKHNEKAITVQWERPATLEKIKETLKEINYPAK
jgi:copper chaperone CopZ